MTRRLDHRPIVRHAARAGTRTPPGRQQRKDAAMSMDWDEAKQKTVKGIQVGDNLETLSIRELEARIAALEAEIARVRAEITRKKAHEAAAAGLFKR
jgi:uncharacterized small protein (DUF1192 family)